MGWFKKEKQEVVEEIPELPELPEPSEFSLPESPELNEVPLPKLPTRNDGFLPKPPSLSVDKEPKELPHLPKLPELKSKPPVYPVVMKQEIIKHRPEMQKSQFRTIETRPRSEPVYRQPPEEIIERQEPVYMREPEPVEISPRQHAKTEPIYVRLDKFELSLQSIEEIKRKIAEVESTLKKIKEIKQREEQELEAWEKEVHAIRSRIDSIDKDIFSKLD